MDSHHCLGFFDETMVPVSWSSAMPGENRALVLVFHFIIVDARPSLCQVEAVCSSVAFVDTSSSLLKEIMNLELEC